MTDESQRAARARLPTAKIRLALGAYRVHQKHIVRFLRLHPIWGYQPPPPLSSEVNKKHTVRTTWTASSVVSACRDLLNAIADHPSRKVLPQEEGWLPYWVLFVSSMAVFNSAQNFVTTKLTRRLYSGTNNGDIAAIPRRAITDIHTPEQ